MYSTTSASLLLAVMFAGYMVYAADRTVLASVLAPMASSLGLTDPQVGLLGSAQYVGVLCFVFVAGHLSDRYGRMPVIVAGLAVFTSFTWLMGLSSNFLEAFLFRLVSGFGEGIFWPVAMAAVATRFSGRKGLALGMFYVGFDVGSATGLILGGLAYQLFADWRPAFFVAPSVGLLVMVGAIIVRRSPTGSGDWGRIRLGRDALQLIRRREVALLMTFALLATWAAVWQVVFLPYYFFKVMHFGILSSALLSSMVAVSGGLGKVVLGGVSDVWRRNRLLVLASLAMLLSYALFFATSDFLLDLAGAVAMGFFSSSIFPIMQALTADTCDGRTGTALGLTTTSQSVATVFSTVIAASLFVLGVGRALALSAMIPAALAAGVAVLLKEPRSGGLGTAESGEGRPHVLYRLHPARPLLAQRLEGLQELLKGSYGSA